MSDPADTIVAEVAKQIEAALARQQSSAATVAADAFDAQQRQGTRSQRILYGGGAGLLMMIGSVAGWVMDKVDEWDRQQQAAIEQLEVIKAIQAEQRVIMGRQLQLGRRLIAVEIAATDGHEWLGKKIDASQARGRSPEQVQRPDTLDAAKARAQSVREQRELGELFGSDALDAMIDTPTLPLETDP